MEGYLLAHDLGTSGDKATIFDLNGRLVASATTPYETRYFNNNWAEQDPEDWWRAVAESSRRIVAGIDPRLIKAIGFSGQMMGCVCVDARGRPLRPAILYCDQRAVDEEALLLSRIGALEFYRITGHRASASYSAAKLMWVKEHESEVYTKTAKMLHAKDFVNFRLTGVMRSEYSDASGTNLLDLRALAWSERLVGISGLDGDKLPELVTSTAVVGELTSSAAAELGLAAGIPVVAGAGDGVCAGVGVGSVEPGVTYNYLGSSSWIATTSKEPIFDDSMRTFVWAHAVPGAYHPCGTSQTAGAAYAWARKALGCPDDYELMNAGVLRSPPGARGLVFLPYLLGERTPRWNPEAKGAFIGLTLAHGRDDMLRAVMEGVTANLSVILGIFRAKVEIPSITVIGGGAKGAVWRQVMADAYRAEILRPKYLEEATSMGAAVIAGVGSGLFPDFSAASRFIEITERTKPNPANAPIYDKLRALMDECYGALEPIFPKLGVRI
ncbi:MAG: xylulokinase [Rectinemataceae bacterium]|jgi:xylulokinase